jgi:hypothetical protein
MKRRIDSGQAVEKSGVRNLFHNQIGRAPRDMVAVRHGVIIEKIAG